MPAKGFAVVAIGGNALIRDRQHESILTSTTWCARSRLPSRACKLPPTMLPTAETTLPTVTVLDTLSKVKPETASALPLRLYKTCVFDPGTVKLPDELFTHLILEITESMYSHGIKTMYVVVEHHGAYAACKAAGADAYRIGPIVDDDRGFLEAVEDQLHRCDLILTSGGVSMGAYDTVKAVLSAVGTVEFTKVAMNPGMPQGHGFVGEEEVPIITFCPRYNKLYSGLEEKNWKIDSQQGMAMLKGGAQAKGGFATRWSWLFDLAQLKAYLAFGRDYEKVYEFSLEK